MATAQGNVKRTTDKIEECKKAVENHIRDIDNFNIAADKAADMMEEAMATFELNQALEEEKKQAYKVAMDCLNAVKEAVAEI